MCAGCEADYHQAAKFAPHKRSPICEVCHGIIDNITFIMHVMMHHHMI